MKYQCWNKMFLKLSYLHNMHNMILTQLAGIFVSGYGARPVPG